jgi:nucleotidyltransferase/DNA polymerase involved in DNA repair
LEELCEELAQRASQEKLKGRTITIEVKNEKFKNKQRSFTQTKFMHTKEQFLKIALQLLDSTKPLEPLR